MGVVLFLLPTTTTLFSTIAKAAAGFALYIAILLAIDAQARDLLKLVWREIKGSIQLLRGKNLNNLDKNGSDTSQN